MKRIRDRAACATPGCDKRAVSLYDGRTRRRRAHDLCPACWRALRNAFAAQLRKEGAPCT